MTVEVNHLTLALVAVDVIKHLYLFAVIFRNLILYFVKITQSVSYWKKIISQNRFLCLSQIFLQKLIQCTKQYMYTYIYIYVSIIKSILTYLYILFFFYSAFDKAESTILCFSYICSLTQFITLYNYNINLQNRNHFKTTIQWLHIFS